MQLGDEPSISQVANRFIGTGLFSAPLPGKLNRPLLSAMLAAGVPFTSTRRSEETSPSGSRWILILPPLKRVLIRCSTETSYRSRVAQRFTCGVCVQLHAAVVRNFHTVHRALATRNCSSSHSPQEVTWPRAVPATGASALSHTRDGQWITGQLYTKCLVLFINKHAGRVHLKYIIIELAYTGHLDLSIL